MSLWTPGGEVPIGRDKPDEPDEAAETAAPETPPLDPDQQAEAEELAREMAAAREQIAAAPASLVVANHVMGLYELAAIHLGQQPPKLSEAALAIDAMAAVLEKLPGRLGENESTLTDALHQLRLVYVEMARTPPEPDGT